MGRLGSDDSRIRDVVNGSDQLGTHTILHLHLSDLYPSLAKLLNLLCDLIDTCMAIFYMPQVDVFIRST